MPSDGAAKGHACYRLKQWVRRFQEINTRRPRIPEVFRENVPVVSHELLVLSLFGFGTADEVEAMRPTSRRLLVEP